MLSNCFQGMDFSIMQVWALLLEATHPRLATDIVYVAGTTLTPFIWFCGLLSHCFDYTHFQSNVDLVVRWDCGQPVYQCTMHIPSATR